jgi:hypothetical protein
MIGVIDTIHKYSFGIAAARMTYLVKSPKLQNLLSNLPLVLLFKML